LKFVLNKVDRDTARISEVENEIFDLFVSLDASDEQLDLDFIYASGKEGWAVTDLDQPREDMKPLLDSIIRTIPNPPSDEGPFFILVTITHNP